MAGQFPFEETFTTSKALKCGQNAGATLEANVIQISSALQLKFGDP